MDFNFFFHRFFHPNSDSVRDPFHEIDEQHHHDYPEGFEQHMSMFHQMEDMFNKMFISPFGTLGFPNFNENSFNEPSPRSSMLKDSEEKACDSSSCKEGFKRDLFPFGEGTKITEKAHSFSYTKFSSVKTIRLPDGTFEEHRTITDNDGNKTTTVRRSIGDTSHEVITKNDKHGLKEKEENFMNIDENELSHFEEKWNKLQSGTKVEPSTSSVTLPTSNPSYLYLLKKFFGPSQKDEVKYC